MAEPLPEKRTLPPYSEGFRDGFKLGFEAGCDMTTDFRKWVAEQYVIFAQQRKDAREKADREMAARKGAML